MQSETTGMEPHTTDDESTTNNRCHSGAGAEADGGVRWFDLNASKRDLLVEIYQMDQPSGQDIRHRMKAEHDEDVDHGRLYPNLNDLSTWAFSTRANKTCEATTTKSPTTVNDSWRIPFGTSNRFVRRIPPPPMEVANRQQSTSKNSKSESTPCRKDLSSS